jgi:subtilisin family serine protease
MRLGGLLRWVLVLAVVLAPVAPVAPSADLQSRSPGVTVDMLDQLQGDAGGDDSFESVDVEVEAIVELRRGTSLPEEVTVQREYTRAGARLVRVDVQMSRVRELSRDPRIKQIRIDGRSVETTRRTAPGVSDIHADRLHWQGITGDGVTVGVIDRGFRPSNPEIAGNVVGYRVFDSDGEWAHGTGVASVVVDTAPNATLHLAAVGPTTTPAEYRNAVRWLRESGADVIVDSGSYFGSSGDSHGDITTVAESAADDVLFVTSAGNYAQRHWTGTHEATGDRQWLQFGQNQGNPLGDGLVSGEVSVGLRWDDPEADYDLYLMRQRTGEDEVVAASKVRQNGTVTATERVTARLPRGSYYVAVRAHDANGHHRIELFATHELGHASPNASLTAPGTAPSVVTVGSYGHDGVKPFSSRGPVGNHTGVDVVAPDSVRAAGLDGEEGTSYAAPYVAGTAALLNSQYPDLSPAQTRNLIRSSARDVGPTGPDVASGYGVVDARSAHTIAEWQSRYDRLNRTTG